MKRFFCPICQKVKHVRVLPRGVDTFQEKIKLRTGECRFHSAGEDRKAINKRVVIHTTRPKSSSKASSPAPAPKGKKKG